MVLIFSIESKMPRVKTNDILLRSSNHHFHNFIGYQWTSYVYSMKLHGTASTYDSRTYHDRRPHAAADPPLSCPHTLRTAACTPPRLPFTLSRPQVLPGTLRTHRRATRTLHHCPCAHTRAAGTRPLSAAAISPEAAAAAVICFRRHPFSIDNNLLSGPAQYQ
jgi:hypothetical protein